MGPLPSTIGPYRVIRQVGEGGMGAVFEAVHEIIQRRVAIKVLHPEAGRSADTINRFINEARAANLVGHSGMVQITDFGKLPDGAGYLVMEYLQGETLSERLRSSSGKLSPSETVQIGSQIAAAVAAAHKKGIIHRDLKPSNVMLVPDSAMPAGERVKILDFGLAKLNEVREAAVVKTNSQAVLGTPIYMSPEQCEGAGRVDAKSDVYSLGCMLYEMLAGRPPFLGDGPGQLIGQHLFKQPEPLGKLAPSASASLLTLVERLLVKSKDERPSMREVQAALESLAAALPAQPRRQEPEGSAVVDAARIASLVTGSAANIMASTLGKAAAETRRPRRRRNLLLICAAGVALITTVTVVLLGLSGSKSPAKSPAVAISPVVPSPPPPAPPPAVAVSSVVPSPPPPAPPGQVTLRVNSQPPGAQIVRLPDGEVLGTTPWQKEMPQSDAPLGVRLRLNRYIERELLLSRQRDDTAAVKLVATPEPRRPQAGKSATAPAKPTQEPPPSALRPATTNAKPIID